MIRRFPYNTTSSYNSASELIFITNLDATYSYTYDEMGRMETVDNAGIPDVPNVVLTYDYDQKGNVISVADAIDGIASGLTNMTRSIVWHPLLNLVMG